MNAYFTFFILSGFCSLVYQVTWLRVAMATYGVTTPTISIVLSVFMAGLAFGSWAGGWGVSRLRSDTASFYLRLYAATEAIIGLAGVIVAPLLAASHRMLMTSAENSWGSSSYYLMSGVLITLSILPFCFCMGATFPLAMAAVRRTFPLQSEKSFSYLYIANVIGAMLGCLSSALIMIELLGFRGTMLVAAGINLLVTCGALALAARLNPNAITSKTELVFTVPAKDQQSEWRPLLLLFMTGLVSLGMEIIWIRLFVPFLGPVVYTFAVILAVYLVSTLIGSSVYRSYFQNSILVTTTTGWQILTVVTGVASLLPLIAADYRLPLSPEFFGGVVRVSLGIGPFCAVLGFLTPGLLDRVAAGDPRKAGCAFALNTIGCIIGPILAGFILLPHYGERWALLLLALPLFVLSSLFYENSTSQPVTVGRLALLITGLAGLAILIITGSRDYAKKFADGIVLHDYTATVIATSEGGNPKLLVNGYGMTVLTPITKMMAHLPLAVLGRQPKTGLILCLGMGTSYRSMLSWGMSATVIELVPSIPKLLPYYHADGNQLLSNSNGRIIIDDARRFLGRSSEIFDVIVVDPPPPVSAATSSLLYSVEFYREVAKRLAPTGIFQQWIPLGIADNDDPLVIASMAKALAISFPHIRVFGSIYGLGLHILASKQPITVQKASILSATMPMRAAVDLVEWGPYLSATEQFEDVLKKEIDIQGLIKPSPTAPVMTDDRPVNEYYLLRNLTRR